MSKDDRLYVVIMVVEYVRIGGAISGFSRAAKIQSVTDPTRDGYHLRIK